ncbi:hypothetical protein BASA83_000859 [Batrachochytrium salamandrivorans]|nr:hypothetical protein BASA83_000859 [Batrachochytrium salamandrivorans]
MKFNALVVAAMVITSVNAAGKGGFMCWFGFGCGSGPGVTLDSVFSPGPSGNGQGPVMPQDTTGNEQEPVVSQESAGREPKSGSSQDPSENDSEPGVPQGPSGNRVKLAIHKLESGMPHGTLGDIPKVVVPLDSPGNGVKLELSQDPSGNGLELAMVPGPSDGEQGQGLSQDPPMRELRQRLLRSPMGKSKDPELEANPICDSIKTELSLLWVKIGDLNREFYGRMPGLYSLLMTKGGKRVKKGKRFKKIKKEEKDRKDSLKDKQIQVWFTLNSRLILKLQEIKEKYDDFGKDRDEILKRLDENECPKTFKRVSLEELTQKGYLPNWKDSKGRDILGDQ